MRAAKVVERKAEAISEIFLEDVHLRAVFVDRQAGFVRCQLGEREAFDQLIERAGVSGDQMFVPGWPPSLEV